MSDYVKEADTPLAFDHSYDPDGYPQREMTDFVVTRGDDKISICSLDNTSDLDSTHVVARGSIVKDGKSIRVVTAPLTEWCIEYSQPRSHLWIRSAAVWYRLTKPAREYAKVHELARRRFELCSRIYILGTSVKPEDGTLKAFVQLLSGPYMDMRGFSEKEILAERSFILDQVKTLNDPMMNSVSFVRELREKKMGGPGGPRKLSGAVGKRAAAAAGSAAYLGPWQPKGTLDLSGEMRLLKRADKAINSLIKQKNSWPFLKPVDPMTDGCPDYLTRIDKPMDLGTIKSRLEKGGCYAGALDVVKDVRLVAANCRKYNGSDHEYAKWATELEKKMENMMRSGEEAELTAMQKRQSAGKKRKSFSDLPPSGKAGAGNGKRAGTAKAARKGSKDKDLSPNSLAIPASTAKVEIEMQERKVCGRDGPDGCESLCMPGSKYCSEECGMSVARKRISDMKQAGLAVGEYIRAHTTKALVRSRG